MPTGEVDELIARFREWTARTEVRATLRREAYPAEARLERELPFLHRSGDTILEGIIDRLVVWDDGAEVIDFKSDVVDPGDEAGLEQLVGIYAPQLEAYREAVAGIFGLPGDAVRAKLVFLRAGAVRGWTAPEPRSPYPESLSEAPWESPNVLRAGPAAWRGWLEQHYRTEPTFGS